MPVDYIEGNMLAQLCNPKMVHQYFRTPILDASSNVAVVPSIDKSQMIDGDYLRPTMAESLVDISQAHTLHSLVNVEHILSQVPSWPNGYA